MLITIIVIISNKLININNKKIILMTYISPEEEENEKYRQFKKDIKDVEGFTNKIEELSFTEISNVFPDILTLNEEEYLESINNGIKIQLSDIYTEEIFSDKTLNGLIEKKSSGQLRLSSANITSPLTRYVLN